MVQSRDTAFSQDESEQQMSGVLKKVIKIGAIVAAVALAIPSVGSSLSLLAVTLGVSGVAAAGIAVGLGVASTLLNRPKAPATSAMAADRLTVSIDTKTPRKIAFGKTALKADFGAEL